MVLEKNFTEHCKWLTFYICTEFEQPIKEITIFKNSIVRQNEAVSPTAVISVALHLGLVVTAFSSFDEKGSWHNVFRKSS